MQQKIFAPIIHGVTNDTVVANGHIEGDFFIGEYTYKGMVFDVTLKLDFNNFFAEKPKEFTPLIVKLGDGSITHAYYVEYSNMVYLRNGTRGISVIEWCYRDLRTAKPKPTTPCE